MKTPQLALFLSIIGLFALSGSSQPTEGTSESEIIMALQSSLRVPTYVALQALKKADIAVPVVRFDKPYQESKAELEALVEVLSSLSDAKLSSIEESFLDPSLQLWWPTRSMIWPEEAHGWKAEIVAALESGSRNRTYLAMNVLNHADVSTPPIDFGKSYQEAKPQLNTLIRHLSAMPKSRLVQLDNSLSIGRWYYSPIWYKASDGWTA